MTIKLTRNIRRACRGTLSSGHSALTSETYAQCWTLDETGNWSRFRTDQTGDGVWNLQQQRTANRVNEITDITQTAGPSWATPAYDSAGNMTTIPTPGLQALNWDELSLEQWDALSLDEWSELEVSGSQSNALTATYDAWNRLVKLENDGGEAIQDNKYDARNYRMVQTSYDPPGMPAESRHSYYSEGWQSLEERLSATGPAERQSVWGVRYIDDCVLRDRSTTSTLDERSYACQDANWNVTALVDTSGDEQERYAYSAYGVPSLLAPDFTARAASDFDWETLYCGYRWDAAVGMYIVRNRILLPEVGV